MRKSTLIFFIVLGTLSVSTTMLYAQSPVFSQYYATGLYLNPAMAGVEKDIFIGLNYRSQWSNVNLPFKTCQLTLINPVLLEGVKPKHLGGWGISLLSDHVGPNREFVTQSISFSGTYNIHFNSKGNNILALGGQLSVTQQQVNGEAMRWSSQFSPGFGFDPSLAGESGYNERVLAPTINMGVLWYYTAEKRLMKRFSVFQGLAFSNLNRPSVFYMDRSFSSILTKVHGGFSTEINSKLDIAPNYMIQYQNTLQINIGAYLSHSLSDILHKNKDARVTAGAWYRVNDALIFSAGLTTTRWNMAFSYDTNSQSLQRNLGNANAFELSMAYKISKLKGYKRFSSPLI